MHGALHLQAQHLQRLRRQQIRRERRSANGTSQYAGTRWNAGKTYGTADGRRHGRRQILLRKHALKNESHSHFINRKKSFSSIKKYILFSLYTSVRKVFAGMRGPSVFFETNPKTGLHPKTPSHLNDKGYSRREKNKAAREKNGAAKSKKKKIFVLLPRFQDISPLEKPN